MTPNLMAERKMSRSSHTIFKQNDQINIHIQLNGTYHMGSQQGRAETFGEAGAQSIKGAHGTQLLIGLCSLLICASKWMLLY